ncbi:hypothetical protein AWB78_06657 [Caballeronia calidae]|uniref:Uncharacterized protein n=1 Tax=Caballeronia calidae TaxID=1777139 RepID=A0A158E9Y6_9BURK|nr:hypothetical protein AWB78_06657 [Caballeronia calidae]
MQRDALHTRPIAYNSWFKRYAVPIPALSVLTLNSGICGDKMHFLAMFKDNETIVTQTDSRPAASTSMTSRSGDRAI